MGPPENPKDEKERWRTSSAIALGTNMVVGMIAFAGLGYYLDQRTGGGAAYTLGGMFVGLAYCGYEVWKVVRQINEDDRDHGDTHPKT